MKVKDVGIARIPKGKVPSDLFKDVQFMSAAEKARVARDWELFVIARINDPALDRETEYGGDFKPFTKALYSHWSQHMGHIAHFNRWGFYAAQFRSTHDFLCNMAKTATGYDGMGWPILPGCGACTAYADLNKVIIEVAKHYLPLVEQLFDEENEAAHAASVEGAKALLENEGFAVYK